MEAAQTPPALPTPKDVQAIFDRAAAAAQRAEDAAGRLEAAQKGAQQETEARFPGMPEELVKQVSDATAKQVLESLNAQYELRGTPPSAAPGTGSAGGTPSSDAGTSSPGTEIPPPASPAPPAKAPRFDNLAHRILGDRPPNG